MCVYMGLCLACYCGGCKEYNADPDGHCCTYCVRDVHCDCDEHCEKDERCCVHCPDGKVDKDKGKSSFILTKRESESENLGFLISTILSLLRNHSKLTSFLHSPSLNLTNIDFAWKLPWKLMNKIHVVYVTSIGCWLVTFLTLLRDVAKRQFQNKQKISPRWKMHFWS